MLYPFSFHLYFYVFSWEIFLITQRESQLLSEDRKRRVKKWKNEGRKQQLRKVCIFFISFCFFFFNLSKDMPDSKEKVGFVKRLLSPDLAEQVQVTLQCVDAAKDAITPPRNHPSKTGKEVVALIQGTSSLAPPPPPLSLSTCSLWELLSLTQPKSIPSLNQFFMPWHWFQRAQGNENGCLHYAGLNQFPQVSAQESTLAGLFITIQTPNGKSAL